MARLCWGSIIKEGFVLSKGTPRFQQLQTTVNYLKEQVGPAPKVAIILGSGLAGLGDQIHDAKVISYDDIPGFAEVTVPGHKSRLISGTLEGCSVVAMQGRFHYYEGYGMETVVYPVQVFALWGVENLIVTNATGGINLTFSVGDLMLIRDVITLFCPSPLQGKNVEELGPRFFDMTKPFSEELLHLAREVGKTEGIPLREGVYVYAQGPHFETPADIRLLRLLGGDVVGMSTVPEVIAARHASMRILGISCVTNMAAGVTNSLLNHEEVLEAGVAAGERFTRLVRGIVRGIGG